MSVLMESSRPELTVTPMEECSAAINGENALVDEEMPQINNKLVDQKNYLDTLLQKKRPDSKPEEMEVVEASAQLLTDDLPKSSTTDMMILPVISSTSLQEANAVTINVDVDGEIKRLQAALYSEETKLLLMKKMFQLQNPPLKPEKKEEIVVESGGKKSAKSAAGLGSSSNAQHQNGIRNQKGHHEMLMGKGDNKHQVRDPKVQSILKGGLVGNNQRLLSNASPTIAELSKLKLAQTSALKYAQGHQTNHGQQHNNQNARSQPPPPPKPQQHPIELLEQQLSAEKAGLKRQMEKSLQQISSPKPPLPDINFIPATVCPDFIALLGMELAANYAINSKNLIDKSPYPEPFLCVKCGEDVCPAWKVDVDSGVVVCEPCYQHCRSNLARLSHIEILKKTFADVLEKERDLDRQHAATLSKAKVARTAVKSAFPMNPSSGNVRTQQHPVVPVNNHHNNSNNNNANAAPPINRLMMKQQQQQQQHHHHQSNLPQHSNRSSLPPPPPSRNLGKPPISSPYAQLGAPQPFAPSSSRHHQNHNNQMNQAMQGMRQSADVQRQYLLDMISNRPRQPPGNGPWRK